METTKSHELTLLLGLLVIIGVVLALSYTAVLIKNSRTFGKANAGISLDFKQ